MSVAWGAGRSRLYEAVVADGIGPLYERLVEQLEPHIAEGSRVVDVGCGPGHVAAILARKRPDIDMLGVDVSEGMIARARRRAARNLRFETADACALPFDDGSFDAAISVASIKHWPDPVGGASQMLRVLRPGGFICVIEADCEASWDSARNFAALWARVPPGSRWIGTLYFRHVVAAQGLDHATLRGHLLAAGAAGVQAWSERDQPVALALGTKPQS